MRRIQIKWAKSSAIFTGSIAIALVLLAAASITIKALADTPTATGISIPLSLQAAAQTTPVNGIALTASAAAAIAAILAAAHRFGLFRESEPHLNISQDITTQPISPNYTLVAVTATIHNTSKVLTTLGQITCQLAQTAPMTDHDVEQIYVNATHNPQQNEYHQYDWWILDQVEKHWPNNGLPIEPAEKHQETFQFIIANSVQSAVIFTATNVPNKVADYGPKCYTFVTLP